MTANPDNPFSSTRGGTALEVVIRDAEKGGWLAQGPVTNADLSELFSEAWRDDCLRTGHPQVPLADVTMAVVPRLKAGSSRRCASFDLEVSVPQGPTRLRSFTSRSLGHVSRRLSQQLVEAGILKQGQLYTYEVVVETQAKPDTSPTTQPPFHAALRTSALTYLRVPLRSMLEQSAAVGLVDDERFPVFYTAQALALAERFARKGAAAAVPVETGGVLIGSLCSCPQSGELFAVVTDVLEVMDAEQREFALAYSGKTWIRIQSIMRARQEAHPDCAERILGQCHGHNFLPNDGKTCEECQHRPTCGLTNVFVSLADQDWSRAVFARQPWHLCHIFGLSARGDKVDALFTQLDNRLQARGYFKLPRFNPSHWTLNPVTKEMPHA